MNGRVAKRLRRAAERATAGEPAVAYNKQVVRRRVVNDGLGANGAPKVRTVEYLGTRTLNPRCIRAVYQQFKRTIKKERAWRAILG